MCSIMCRDNHMYYKSVNILQKEGRNMEDAFNTKTFPRPFKIIFILYNFLPRKYMKDKPL